MSLNLTIGNVLKNTLQRFLIRSTDDFIQAQKYNVPQSLTDIQLLCQGYAVFNPQEILQNFILTLQRVANQVQTNTKIQIKSIKINLNGFKLDSKKNYIQKITKSLKKMGINLKNLWVHTSDLSGVRISDFKYLYSLIAQIGGQNNFNFQDFSLQCANWTFQKLPPKFQQLKSILQQSLQSLSQLGYRLHQKHIRLQISGWYYNIYDAQYFLDYKITQQQLLKIRQKDKQKYNKYRQAKNQFTIQTFDKSLQLFHLQMQVLISKLVQVMQQIEQLQIDMRNTHQLLKTKKLKQRIVSSVTKNNRTNKSMISMRQKQKIQQNQINQRPFRLNIVM